MRGAGVGYSNAAPAARIADVRAVCSILAGADDRTAGLSHARTCHPDKAKLDNQNDASKKSSDQLNSRRAAIYRTFKTLPVGHSTQSVRPLVDFLSYDADISAPSLTVPDFSSLFGRAKLTPTYLQMNSDFLQILSKLHCRTFCMNVSIKDVIPGETYEHRNPRNPSA